MHKSGAFRCRMICLGGRGGVQPGVAPYQTMRTYSM